MRALLDTHTFLWWVLDDPQLSPLCRQIIADGSNTIYFSAASAWEIAIKYQIGKLALPDLPEPYVTSRVALNSFQILAIELSHALHIPELPMLHRDPFDRILIAQSQKENMSLLTADPLIAQYSVQTLW
jgi:PIN domain nuclease of toxin-antitoxin system